MLPSVDRGLFHGVLCSVRRDRWQVTAAISERSVDSADMAQVHTPAVGCFVHFVSILWRELPVILSMLFFERTRLENTGPANDCACASDSVSGL